MNRIWAAIVIIVMLVGMCIFGTVMTDRMTTDISTSLLKISDAIREGDSQKAESLSKSANKDWQKYHKRMSMYIPHDRLEEISQTMAVLPTMIVCGSNEDAQAECARAQEQIRHVFGTELPTMDNIL